VPSVTGTAAVLLVCKEVFPLRICEVRGELRRARGVRYGELDGAGREALSDVFPFRADFHRRMAFVAPSVARNVLLAWAHHLEHGGFHFGRDTGNVADGDVEPASFKA
jgi:hypothetical protein